MWWIHLFQERADCAQHFVCGKIITNNCFLKTQNPKTTKKTGSATKDNNNEYQQWTVNDLIRLLPIIGIDFHFAVAGASLIVCVCISLSFSLVFLPLCLGWPPVHILYPFYIFYPFLLQMIGFLLIGVGVYARAASIVTNLPIVGGILACGVILICISMLGLAGAVKHHQVMLFFVSFLQRNLVCRHMKEYRQQLWSKN